MKAVNRKQRKRAALLGLGLDDDGGTTRVTRGANFLLYGGSDETHSRMRETVTKLNEQIDRQGKRLEDLSPGELSDLFRDLAR